MINIYYFLITLISLSYAIPIIPKPFKYLFLTLLAIHTFISMYRGKIMINKYQLMIISLIIIYPLINTLFNDILFQGTNEAYAYVSIIHYSIFLFASFNREPKDDVIIKIIIYCISIGAIVSLSINLLILIKLLNVENLRFLSNVNSLSIDFFVGDQRPIEQGLMSRFYLSSTILFVIPTIYFLFRSNLLLFFILLFSIILSTSRASLAVCLVAFIFYVLTNKNITKAITKSIFISFSSILIILQLYPRSIELLNFLDKGDIGISGLDIRFGYILSYFENLSLFRFLFGNGSNTLIYNYYREEYSKTEISQLNFLYENGIIISLCALLIFFVVIKNNYFNNHKIEKHYRKPLSISMFFFFVSSLSNPVLMHPISIFIFSLLTKKFLQTNYEKHI